MTSNAQVVAQPRDLPLRVRLVAGEALDSWLLRLAHRNGVPLLRLAHLLGLSDRLKVWRNYALTKGVPAEGLRRIEAQTGLPAGRLDGAVLDRFDSLGWTPIPGSRYCPRCLDENGGWWPLRWQLPHTFACLTHHCLLVTVCPACLRTPHSRVSDRSGLAGSTRCALSATRHGRPCDADLLTTDWPVPLPDDDPRLAAQAWIEQRLDSMDPAAVTALRDLDAITAWLPRRVTLNELEQLGPATLAAVSSHRERNNALRRHNPAAGLVAAAMACRAIAIITFDPSSGHRATLAPLTRDVVQSNHQIGQAPAKGGLSILSMKRLTTLSPPLQRTVLQGIDQDLGVSERLRYRTRTPFPCPPDQNPDTVAGRARHLPQRLWPDWLVRFHPSRGTNADEVAVTITAALLIPGNPTRNSHAVSELTTWRPHMSNFLSTLAREHADVLTAICNIAEHLDTHHVPIDYRRRRTVFTTVDLSAGAWEALCSTHQYPPGRGLRLLHARRHLFTLLTGADLGDTRHHLALTRSDERAGYQAFELQMPAALRAALHDHAATLLAAGGIDEPVTWSPPAGCAAGLELPGREPDDVDTPSLRTLISHRTSPSAAADLLGVSTEHVRYTIGQLRLPALKRPREGPRRATKKRARAEQLLTAEFFHRENDLADKSLAALAGETGFSRTMIGEYAQRAGIQLARRRIDAVATEHGAVPGDGIDPGWLHEQAGTLRRTNTDIAAELGVNAAAIAKLRSDLGIPPRPQGLYSDRLYPTLPTEIRRAVEGHRAGWQRLRRFEEAAEHHSIKNAAASLGHHHQNLNRQIRRLEADVGAQLLVPGHRYQPHTTTPLGRRVLDQLQHPEVRELLDTHAPPRAHQGRQPRR